MSTTTSPGPGPRPCYCASLAQYGLVCRACAWRLVQSCQPTPGAWRAVSPRVEPRLPAGVAGDAAAVATAVATRARAARVALRE